jgi:CHAD domain-containing protein
VGVTEDAREPSTTDANTPAGAAGVAGAPSPTAAAASIPVLAERPEPIEVADTLATAGRKAMWPHVERMLAREAGLLDPERADDLRKYRVATRRLRVGMRVFGAAYPRRTVRTLRDDLNQLADAIGVVRDLDLRIADLNQWAVDQDPAQTEAVAPLLAAWTDARAAAQAELAHHLASRRHGRLLVALADLVTASTPASDDGDGRRIGDRLASDMWRRYETIRRYAPLVRWADVETLHQLRIAAKRLRDGLDLLGDVVGPNRALLTDRLVALQDHLGALNDAAVTADGVRLFLERRNAGLAPAERAAITAYLADRERDVARRRRSISRVWRPVAGITFARRLGRLVVQPLPR